MLTIETKVLAENLYFLYTEKADWIMLEGKDKDGWIRLAEYVLDREKHITYVAYHKRAVKRQLERLKVRYETSIGYGNFQKNRPEEYER